jgi:hypothetical protein
MRKSRSRFALMPQSIREQLNRQLDDGAQYEHIRHWLFAETADRDIPALDLKTGDPYSLVWTRTTPGKPSCRVQRDATPQAARKGEPSGSERVQPGPRPDDDPAIIRNFGVALSSWYHTHFQAWREEQSKRNREGYLRIVKSADDLAATVGKSAPSPEASAGAQHLIRSLLVDAIGKTSNSDQPNPTDLARLAHAWARINQTDLAAKRHELAAETTTDLAIKAFYNDIKDIPQAMEAFKQFHAIVKQSTAASNPSTS